MSIVGLRYAIRASLRVTFDLFPNFAFYDTSSLTMLFYGAPSHLLLRLRRK